MKSESKMVTFLVRTFNSEKTVRDALESVLTQDTTLSKDVVVIDDGSTDSTHSILDSYGSQIRRFQETRTGGLPLLNRGLEEAHGELFMVVDSDDLLLPGAVTSLSQALLRDPQNGFAFGDYLERDVVTGAEVLKKTEGDYLQALVGGVLFRTDALRKVNGFDSSLGFPDYDTFLKIDREEGVGGVYIERPVYVYIRRAGSITMSQREKIDLWKKQLVDKWGPLTIRDY